MCLCKKAGDWKKDCPRLKHRKENNKQKLGDSRYERKRGTRTLRWEMKRPVGSLGLEASSSSFPTGAPGQL